MQKTTSFIAIKKSAIDDIENEYEELWRETTNTPVNTDNVIEAERQFTRQENRESEQAAAGNDQPEFPGSWDEL